MKGIKERPFADNLPEEDLRRILDSIPQHLFVLGSDGRVLHTNPSVLEYYGFTLADLQVKNGYLRVVHPDDVAEMWAKYESGLSCKAPFELEARFLRKDGEYRWFRVRVNPLWDDTGRILCWSESRIDIEDRKQAEAQLRLLIESTRKTQMHLADAQTLTHTGSWTWDVLRQKDIYWSDELYRIWGLDPKQGLAAAIPRARQRLHPEDLSPIIDAQQRAIRQKSDFTLDFRILLPDGSMRYAHSIAHPVLDDRGNVVELMGTVMDVTQQHEARMVLQKAVHENRKLRDQLYRENLVLKEEIDRSSMFEEIVGRSPALQSVLARIAKVAPTDSTVLITGETGTGKELIARAIHKRSARSSGPFVSVNCAAIPPSLVVSELFGHERGAFTGALSRRLGRFELAESGTIFLDEVGDLSAETQIALLRVLQEREFQRVGGHQSIRSDVRVIAATNSSLETAIASGTFGATSFIA